MDAREVIDDAMPENRAEVEAPMESNQRMFLLRLAKCHFYSGPSLSENITRTVLTSLIEKQQSCHCYHAV